MSRIKPTGHHIIVAWEGLDVDERGRQIVPGSSIGLVYGREVHPPVARVLDIGPRVVGLAIGERIIATKDMGALVPTTDDVDALEVQGIATHELNRRTERMDPTDEVVARLLDEGPVAYGRRIIGRPKESEAASDIIDGVTLDDGAERLEVMSVGPDAHGLSVGDVVLVPHGSKRRVEWQDAGTAYVSVIADEVVAVLDVAPERSQVSG